MVAMIAQEIAVGKFVYVAGWEEVIVNFSVNSAVSPMIEWRHSWCSKLTLAKDVNLPN